MKKTKLSLLCLLLAVLGFAQRADADVSGTVYQDLPLTGSSLNTYGVKESNEQGLPGITVTVFNSDGVSVNSTTTAADGSWSIVTPVGEYRVEFSNIPNYLKSSPVNTGSNTTIQFVSDAATNVDLGLYVPDDFTDTSNPEVVISSFGGVPSSGAAPASIFSYPYSNNGQNEDDTYDGPPTAFSGTPPLIPGPTTDATIAQTGSTWGLAYQKNQQRYFSSTLLRRHLPIGDTTGTIFVIDKSNSPAAGSLVHQFDLNGVNTASGGIIDLGSICRGTGGCENDPGNTGIASDYTLASSPGDPSIDLDAADKIGKIAFGDIDMEPQTNNLWAVNLNQKALIKMDVSNTSATSVPSAVDQYLIENMPNVPVCSNGELRPWGLNFSQGKGYLGVACDASNGGTMADLDAFVVSFDPANIAAGFTTELNIPINSSRNTNSLYDFAPWTSDFDDFRFTGIFRRYALPQAIISDIEFDSLGNINVAVIDRAGLQFGFDDYIPESNTIQRVDIANFGDVFHACKVTTGFELEGTGTCPTNFNSGSQGFSNAGEFFEDTSGDFSAESAMGALASLKGSGEMLMTVLDPHPSGQLGAPYFFTQGANVVDTNNGDIERYYTLYASNNTQEFGKAAGTGDIELLTTTAPIEIGNLIWLDENGDGIQTAGENGIAGVTVELLDDTDTVIATAITDSNGNYLFSSDPNGTTFTAGDSKVYQLSDLNAASSYTVRVPDINGTDKQTALSNYFLTNENIGQGNLADSNDSDGIEIGINADATVLATDIPFEGNNNHTFDFGFVPAGSWSGNVSEDMDFDSAIDDSDDNPISGVTISLYPDTDGDGVLSTAELAVTPLTTQTDTLGNYSFIDLAPGDYIAVETQPTGYLDVIEDEGGVDNDENGTTVLNSISGTVEPDENDANNDFVEIRLGSWSGNVSKDTDNNDTGDVNLEGVTIMLFNDPDGDGQPDGPAIASTTTGTDGNYSFTGLMPGNYVAVETQPTGLLNVSENEGGADNDKPSNNTLNSIAGTVRSGENDVNNDFVEEEPGNWSGNVSQDTNNDDTGDLNLEGVTIMLFNDTNGDGQPDGSAVATTTTGTDGNYSFTGLTPGDYVAVETQPVNLIDVSENEGGLDNDKLDNSTFNSIAGTVDAGETDVNNDFVEEEPASLGDTVWYDDNGNGIEDTGELGVENVTIYLLDNAGTRIPGKVVTTNTSGFYEFTGLAPDTYSVEFDLTSLPTGYEVTALNAGTNEAKDSDADPTSGITSPVTLEPGDNNPNIDMGIFQKVSLGSTVFIDRNNDGLQGADEGGIVGVTLQLFNAGDDPTTDTPIATIETDLNGDYLFDELIPGSYFVYIPEPPIGAPGSSTDIASSSADNQVDGDDNGQQTVSGDPVQSPVIVLGVGTEPTDGTGVTSEKETGSNSTGLLQDNGNDANGDMTVDFGFVPSSIGDTIWHDVDYSGGSGPNLGDIPLANVTVTLTPPLDVDAGAGVGVALTTTTDTDGNYLFELLPPGEYTITVDTSTGDIGSNPDLAIFVDPDVVKDSSSIYVLESGEQNIEQDFAYASLGGVSGNVSEDVDNDGIGDEPLANVTLQLLDVTGQPVLDNGSPITTTTDDDGNYSFMNLIPGAYQIAQIQPQGYISVSDVDGNDQNNMIGDLTPIGVSAGNIVPAQDFVERRGSPTDIPTLSEWALILLMMMLGLVGHRQSVSQKNKKRAF